MNTLYFWKSWNSPYKQIYIFLLSVFAFTLLALAYASYTGMQEVVKWEVETELEPVKVVVDQFARNLFKFTVESESFYALDKFVSTDAQANLPYAYLYLSVLMIGILFILTTFSYLDLYWFMGGMLGFLFFLFTMKIEMLQLFGRVDSAPMVVIFLAYGGLSFVFNSYYKSASYLFRLLCYLGLTLVVGFVVYKYAFVSTPFLYLANFGSLVPVLVAVVFVFIVGYDIIKGFLYVVSSSKTAGSKNAVLNLVFASLLYLVNVLLLLLKKLYIIHLDIVYLNPFLLLVVSAILGIWMFKKRTEMFSTVLPFAPAGAYVYLSLAIITFAGAGYAFVNGNIGIIESYERIIVYGHLFLGVVFLIYILINFGVLFDKKVSIYEIVYKPARMTFLVVPAIGITISVFFFLYQKKYPYQLAMAGYYTYAGDVMTYEGQYPLAFEYYKTAISFDYPNHRANYSIASLCASLNDKETAKGYYESALYRDPTVQSYVGLSNAYMETGELFKALFSVQEALKKFPDEGRLYNNLAVLYHKSNLADSAIYYFLKSRDMLNEKQVAFTNILYLLGKKDLIEDADSIIQTENYPDHISFVNNKLAILNRLGKKSDTPFDASKIRDTVLNGNTYAYLVNSNLNSLHDTSKVIDKLIDSLRNKTSNVSYKDNLTAQLALKKYYTGKKFEAVQDMLLLKVTSPQSSEYPTFLGFWMLEQEQYELSSEFYKRSIELGKQDIAINYAFASAIAGRKDDALFVLSQLTANDPDGLYGRMIQLLNVKSSAALDQLDKVQQLQWLLYNIASLSPETAENLVHSFQDPMIKLFAGNALCRYYLEQNNLAKANEAYALVENTTGLNFYAERDKNYTSLLLKTAMKDATLLENAISLSLSSDKELMRDYFIASAFAFKGDTTQASFYYLKTLSGAPYSEAVIPSAIAYLSKHGHQQTAYAYLVEIVQNDPSVKMRRAYLELCLDMALVSYAESTLTGLKGQISPGEYAQYQNRFLTIQNQ